MATLISVDERVSTPRGRKADIDPKLVKLLEIGKLPLNKAVVLGEAEGIPQTAKPGKDRSRVQNRIRSHWKAAGRTEPVSIRFTPDGWPQVSVNTSKVDG